MSMPVDRSRRAALPEIVHLVLNADVTWRQWDDGVVLFSPRAAETVLMPSGSKLLLNALAGPNGCRADDGLVTSADNVPIVEHLLRLRAVAQHP